MKKEIDYTRDIADIRSMMERSSKFLSLSGWAGIMAGIYALAGAFIAWKYLNFNPVEIVSTTMQPGRIPAGLPGLILLAATVLVLATGTASVFSYTKAGKKGEKIWNPTTRRLLISMAVPLVTGGILIIVMISKGLIGLAAPFTLIFYGLALFNAGKFTYDEVRIMGFIQVGLGLISAYFVAYGLFIWALGFGVVHIVYGIYMHYRYEK